MKVALTVTRRNLFFNTQLSLIPLGTQWFSSSSSGIRRLPLKTVSRSNSTKQLLQPSESHVTQPINPKSRDTLITFAEPAQASYDHNAMSVLDSDGFSISQEIGWDKVGVRSYVWTDSIKDNVIVAFKETSVSFPGSILDTIPQTPKIACRYFTISSHLNQTLKTNNCSPAVRVDRCHTTSLFKTATLVTVLIVITFVLPNLCNRQPRTRKKRRFPPLLLASNSSSSCNL